MLTTFGRFLRDLRFVRNELLKDMAESLGVSAAFLSAVETGKKSIPEGWLERIRVSYRLSQDQDKTMREAYEESPRSVTIDLTDQPGHRRGVAVALARHFDELSDDELESIRQTMLTVRRRGKEE